MGASASRHGNTGASFTIEHAAAPEDTYDVELHRLLDETILWVDALKGPLRVLVEECGQIAPDASMDALTRAKDQVNGAMEHLIKAVYERTYP